MSIRAGETYMLVGVLTAIVLLHLQSRMKFQLPSGPKVLLELISAHSHLCYRDKSTGILLDATWNFSFANKQERQTSSGLGLILRYYL